MKYFFLFFLSFVVCSSIHAQEISIEEAYKKLVAKDNNITQKNVYYSPKTLNPKEQITGFKPIKSPDYKAWYFFVDEYPYQNWEHACYYAFVNCKTGELEIVKAKFPPKLENMKVKVIQPMSPKGKLFDFKKEEFKLKSTTTYDASNDYAVIISGGGDNENNWVRYWNDCSAMYSALVNVYNYSPSHIYVIMSDGTSSGNDRVLSAYQDLYGYWHYTRDSSPLDLDGNGTNDINYSATKSNISTVFNTLSGILNSDDHLFVFTTDHGGQESGDDVYMYLWGETIRDDQFADELDKVHAGKITVTMGQCNSGGFVNDLSGDGRIISTACTVNEFSWSLANGTYDEYLYHWISAIAGETPESTDVDADDNNDGWVSMREAFEYANANDNAHINGIYWQGVTYFETPQYNSSSAGLGCFVRLSDNWNWSLTGPSLICSSSATFTVNNLPTGTTVSWDESANLTEDPQNPGTFTANGLGAGWVEATLTTGCGEITLPRKTIWAGPKASFTGPTFIAYGGTGTYIAEQSCGYYEWYLQKEGASGGILVQTGNPLTLRSVPRYGKVANIEDPVTRKPPPVGSTVYYLWINAIAPGVGAASSTHLKITANGDVDLVPEDIMMAGMEVSQKSGIEIFPNPATGEATLTIQTPEVSEMVEANTEWELEIYTQSQLLKEKKTNLKGNSTKLQTAGWKEGIYIVRVNFNNKILTGKLVVKK